MSQFEIYYYRPLYLENTLVTFFCEKKVTKKSADKGLQPAITTNRGTKKDAESQFSKGFM